MSVRLLCGGLSDRFIVMDPVWLVGAGRSSVVERTLMARRVVGSILSNGPCFVRDDGSIIMV